MKHITYSWLWVALLGLVLAGCDKDAALKKQISAAVAQGRLDVKRETQFQWDALHVFAPYTAKAKVRSCTGWKGPISTDIETSDAVYLFVFMQGGKLVKAVDVPRTHGLTLMKGSLCQKLTPTTARFVLNKTTRSFGLALGSAVGGKKGPKTQATTRPAIR